jgi:hypothetical protein
MAAAIVRAKFERIASNRGHVRLFVVISLAWMAATTWLLWTPLPPAPPTSDSFGMPTPTACMEIVLDHDQCVADENFKATARAIISRAIIILFVPLILPLSLALAALLIEWIKEGYRGAPSAKP